MSVYEIIPFTKDLEKKWDDWCADSINGNFLTSRKFLNYHGDRFKDLSLVIQKENQIVGVFPAAQDPKNSQRVSSHPGSTYGGIVHDGRLTGSKMHQVLELVRKYYGTRGFKKILYKVVPHIYFRSPAQDDLHGLFRHQAVRVNCGLSCAVDLKDRVEPSDRRKRSLKKALKNVQLSSEPHLLGDLWSVVEANLDREHKAKATHSREEILFLQSQFPESILVRTALIDGKVEAGVVFFNSQVVWHSQYIASTEKGYSVSALDAVFEEAITQAKSADARFFDFGTSNESQGEILNEGLYQFKSEFGGGGVVHEFYEMDVLL